jgi:hypothetical protein
MAWNDWKAALKERLAYRNPNSEAAKEAYMVKELTRTGQLPTGEPPPRQAMWNPISEERQRALATAETSPTELISTGPWATHRDAPDTRTRYTVGLSKEGFHFSHETQSPKGLDITPWSKPMSMGDVEKTAAQAQQRIVAPERSEVPSVPKAAPLSMSAFSKGMLEETRRLDRGPEQKELVLQPPARGRGRGLSV